MCEGAKKLAEEIVFHAHSRNSPLLQKYIGTILHTYTVGSKGGTSLYIWRAGAPAPLGGNTVTVMPMSAWTRVKGYIFDCVFIDSSFAITWVHHSRDTDGEAEVPVEGGQGLDLGDFISCLGAELIPDLPIQ